MGGSESKYEPTAPPYAASNRVSYGAGLDTTNAMARAQTTMTVHRDPAELEVPSAAAVPRPLGGDEASVVAGRLGLRVTGLGSRPALLSPGPLRDAIVSALPPDCQQSWHRVYSSLEDGRSFARLVSRVAERGATVVVFREEGAGGRIFGGFNEQAWMTVSRREEAAKFNAAARHRAERDGANLHTLTSRPDSQSVQFFGNDACFVFTSGDTDYADGIVKADDVRIYKAKHTPATNANYMYLFDTHPNRDRVGIGMGADSADGVGGFAWYVDGYLARGVTHKSLCPTFGSPRLASSLRFQVVSAEAYCVDAVVVDRLRSGDPVGVAGASSDPSVLDRHREDKALLQLDGRKFYSEENEREDCT